MSPHVSLSRAGPSLASFVTSIYGFSMPPCLPWHLHSATLASRSLPSMAMPSTPNTNLRQMPHLCLSPQRRDRPPQPQDPRSVRSWPARPSIECAAAPGFRWWPLNGLCEVEMVRLSYCLHPTTSLTFLRRLLRPSTARFLSGTDSYASWRDLVQGKEFRAGGEFLSLLFTPSTSLSLPLSLMRAHADLYAGVGVRVVFGCQSRHDRQLALPGAILLRHRFHTQSMVHGACLARAVSLRPPCELVLARFPIFLTGDFVSFLFSIFRFISFPSDLGHSVVCECHRYALPSIFLGPKPHGLALVGGYGVEPAVVGGFPKKFLFCFSVFLSLLPRRFVIRLALAARASLPVLPTPTLVALGTVRVFISRDRVSRSMPVAPSYKRSSLQHSRSLPTSAGYPIPHSG
ncbi:hypothetical protein B0H14DRAFT_3544361 [Mycena olivaceomarginata]|nr:hypothetical protein B0H14DRAFT_3544361 [Mycena olivaceomarginata]